MSKEERPYRVDKLSAREQKGYLAPIFAGCILVTGAVVDAGVDLINRRATAAGGIQQVFPPPTEVENRESEFWTRVESRNDQTYHLFSYRRKLELALLIAGGIAFAIGFKMEEREAKAEAIRVNSLPRSYTSRDYKVQYNSTTAINLGQNFENTKL